MLVAVVGDFSSTSFSSTVDVVRIAVTVVVEVVEHPPSAMLWLLLLRWCAHEDLLSQSRWRSWLQGHLIVVVVAIGLGRLQLGCHVVVVVGLRSQFLVPDQTVNETGLDRCLRRSLIRKGVAKI